MIRNNKSIDTYNLSSNGIDNTKAIMLSGVLRDKAYQIKFCDLSYNQITTAKVTFDLNNVNLSFNESKFRSPRVAWSETPSLSGVEHGYRYRQSTLSDINLTLTSSQLGFRPFGANLVREQKREMEFLKRENMMQEQMRQQQLDLEQEHLDRMRRLDEYDIERENFKRREEREQKNQDSFFGLNTRYDHPLQSTPFDSLTSDLNAALDFDLALQRSFNELHFSYMNGATNESISVYHIMSDIQFEKLIDDIKLNFLLKELTITNANLNDFQASMIGDAVSAKFTLEHLDLSGNSLTYPGVLNFLDKIKTGTPLKTINLSNNKITNKFLLKANEVVMRFGLQELNLSGNYLEPTPRYVDSKIKGVPNNHLRLGLI